MSEERPYFCTSAATGTKPIEFFNLEKQRNDMVLASNVDLKDEIRTILNDVPNWLPIASEVLGISKDIKDFILAPVISMPSDLPNRNQQAFPLTELTRWQPDFGMPMYKTWNGKPMFTEHANSDPTKAKGIILNTLLRPIANSDGDIYKVIKLAAWDRNRDSVAANDILTRKISSYSMGSYAKDYSCSICGSRLTKGGCEHVEHGRPLFKCFSADGMKQVAPGTPGAQLAYHNTMDCCGFELSLVKSPAFYSAKDVNYFTMSPSL
jgi:hypothetical protein